MTAAARRQVFQTKKFSDAVLEMDDQVAFFQFGEVNVEGGTGGQRVRGFQPAWPLDFVASEYFRVGDDNEFCLFAKEPAGERADSSRRSGVWVLGLRGARVFQPEAGLPDPRPNSFQISSNRCRSPSLLQKT